MATFNGRARNEFWMRGAVGLGTALALLGALIMTLRSAAHASKKYPWLAFLAKGRTGAKLELPGGLILERERGRIRLRPGRAQHGC